MSNHASLVQYRARKQAAVSSVGRLLTRAVLYRCLNVAWPDLASTPASLLQDVIFKNVNSRNLCDRNPRLLVNSRFAAEQLYEERRRDERRRDGHKQHDAVGRGVDRVQAQPDLRDDDADLATRNHPHSDLGRLLL